MIGLLAFVLNVKFILGVVIGGLVGHFVLPFIWKPRK